MPEASLAPFCQFCHPVTCGCRDSIVMASSRQSRAIHVEGGCLPSSEAVTGPWNGQVKSTEWVMLLAQIFRKLRVQYPQVHIRNVSFKVGATSER
jgi:hypothetical protein